MTDEHINIQKATIRKWLYEGVYASYKNQIKHDPITYCVESFSNTGYQYFCASRNFGMYKQNSQLRDSVRGYKSNLGTWVKIKIGANLYR